MRKREKRRGERGTALFVGTVSLLVVIPMVGLAIDVGYLYACKTRLQSAVDGAALAAARALNLGQTTTAQATSAKQNAVNWFYANFPPANWATSSTVMNQNTVQVFDSPANPSLRNVTVTATTTVPTYFMRWLNFNSTVINSVGNASRRDAVIMLVLDRSGSMCSPGSSPCNTTGACGSMKSAAKLFTGQFAPQRDRIGLVSFSDGTYMHQAPTQNFQAVLGYSNSFGSATGMIDTIQCQGGTGSAQAISIGYNELYKTNLPGALNLILFESDGLPNTLTLNWWDSASQTYGIKSISPASDGTQRGCRDASNQTKYQGGWDNNQPADARQWTPGYNMNVGGTGYMSNVPAGSIGGLYSSDPSQNGGNHYFIALMNPYHPDGSYGGTILSSTAAPNCRFKVDATTNVTDFSWIPSTDVFGNQLNPANAYLPVTMDNGRVKFLYSGENSDGYTSAKWTNYHNAAYNATDNAAYRARTNPNLPVYMFVIGLGGQGSDPPDYTLMQRIANDPRPDGFNAPPLYAACASTPNCVNYSTQPQGQFVFSTNQTQLQQAFLQLSSQILRLSQ